MKVMLIAVALALMIPLGSSADGVKKERVCSCPIPKPGKKIRKKKPVTVVKPVSELERPLGGVVLTGIAAPEPTPEPRHEIQKPPAPIPEGPIPSPPVKDTGSSLRVHLAVNFPLRIMPGVKVAMVGPEIGLYKGNLSFGASYAAGGAQVSKRTGNEVTRFANMVNLYLGYRWDERDGGSARQLLGGPEFLWAGDSQVETFHLIGGFMAYEHPLLRWLSLRLGGGAGKMYSNIASTSDNGLALHAQLGLVGNIL